MTMDITKMTMTEIIRLQDLLSKELAQRFEHPLALAFSDIVGSTPYFAQYGDEAGRKLQQRHFDLIHRALEGHEDSRIVDTAGDGAFLSFPTVEHAIDVLVDLQKRISEDNLSRPRAHELHVRIGVHQGRVLTDGVEVTGDAVNLCSRVASTTQIGEIRLTGEAVQAFLDIRKRLACRPIPPVTLKGVARPVDVFVYEWLDRRSFPDRVRIEETGEEITLPNLDTLTFGRLKDAEGGRGNDIVLALPDPLKSKQISRFHFELRRLPDRLVLRQVSDQTTEVDSQPVAKGEEVVVRQGTVVTVGRVMTLVFDATVSVLGAGSDSTVCPSS